MRKKQKKNKNYLKKIPLSEPYLFGAEKKYVTECVETNWLASGKYVDKFENIIKDTTNSKFVLSSINGTSSLQLALRILDPKPGDEVLVPTITFIAPINSVIYNFCAPVFFDCDENLNINTIDLINFIKFNTYYKNDFSYNKKTHKKIIAMIVVHVFGESVNLESQLIDLCKARNIKIIEDAAESFGTFLKKDKNKTHTGTIGDIGCFSFNGNKIVTAGGGGALTFKNKAFYLRAKYLLNQAKDDSDLFIHNDVGYNFRLSNLHAAIGFAQIKNLKKILIKKKNIHNNYKKEINKIFGLTILESSKHSTSNYWLNTLIVDKKKYGLTKLEIIKKLKKHNIETRSLWFPNHLQKPFKNYEKYKINKAQIFFEKSICLPSSYNLQDKDLKKIVNILEENKR